MFSNSSGVVSWPSVDSEGEGLPGRRGLRADLAGGELGTLRAHRSATSDGVKPYWRACPAQPDAHRVVLGAEQ
jgi:hypothetical protein